MADVSAQQDDKQYVKELVLSEYISKYGNNVGISIPPKTYIEIKSATDAETGETLALHLTNACLGIDAKVGERAVITFTDLETDESNEIVIGCLSAGVSENTILDLVIQGDCTIGNLNAENTPIHIVGRITSADDGVPGEDEEDDEDEYEDDLEDGDDEEEHEYFLDDLDDDDDDDDSDYVDDDGDLGHVPSKTKIEMLPDEDDDDEPQSDKSKRPKLMSGVNGKMKDSPNGALKASDKEKNKGGSAAAGKMQDSTPSKASMTLNKMLQGSAKSEINKTTSAVKNEPPKGHNASKTATDATVAAEKVITFIKEELGKTKSCKGADLGTAISAKFKVGLKKMGFEQKTLQQFVQAHANGSIVVENDVYKLK